MSDQHLDRDKDTGADDVDGDEDSEDEAVDMDQGRIGGKTASESMRERIAMLKDFVGGLEYQLQFDDRRMLDRMEREGGSFFRFMEGCLSRERRMNSTRGSSPTTWGKEETSAMFYRTRPPRRDNDS